MSLQRRIALVRAYIRRFALALACVTLSACTPCVNSDGAKSPAREQVRGVVLGIAQGVKVADTACATIAKSIFDTGARAKAIALARVCVAAYDQGRTALLMMQDALDTWTAAELGKVSCAARAAVASMQSIVNELTILGYRPPPELVDAVALANWAASLTNSCPVITQADANGADNG